jgi:lipid-binding SYLF domain-containing protein
MEKSRETLEESQMQARVKLVAIGILTVTMSWIAGAARPAAAASAAEIRREVDAAMPSLMNLPGAKALVPKAVAVLVFPSIIKGGFIIGGQYGEGALRKKGKTVAYYNTVSASYGLQAGVQKFGYALVFMNQKALSYLDQSQGWEIGVGPSVVVVDEGFAKSMTSTTLQDDVYAFFFNQQGLMAGLGLQGTKITRIHPD